MTTVEEILNSLRVLTKEEVKAKKEARAKVLMNMGSKSRMIERDGETIMQIKNNETNLFEDVPLKEETKELIKENRLKEIEEKMEKATLIEEEPEVKEHRNSPEVIKQIEDKIKKQKELPKGKYECDCGSILCYSGRPRHERTIKHETWLFKNK